MKLGQVGRMIRAGVIGLGNRSKEQIRCLAAMKDIEIAVVCDVYEDRVKATQDAIEAQCGVRPEGTCDYREVNARSDIEAVFIFTSWQTHVRIAVDAMRHGVTPAMEVGGATSLEECWELVRTSESTGIPVMLLENCCYNKEEMALLNMIRQGAFGETIVLTHDCMLPRPYSRGGLDDHHLPERAVHCHGLHAVAVPDFTGGRWIKREVRPGDMFSLDAVYPEAFE